MEIRGKKGNRESHEGRQKLETWRLMNTVSRLRPSFPQCQAWWPSSRRGTVHIGSSLQ